MVRGNAKARNTRQQRGEVETLGKAIAGTASAAPARALQGQLAQTPTERAALEPTGSNPTNYDWIRAREAPLWWHADLCEDKEYSRSDEDWKTTTLGRILAEESHKTPGKILAGDDCAPRQDPCRAPGKAHAEGISGATARPTPAKFPPSLARSCQPDQLGRHLRGNMQLPGQLSTRLRGDMQIFVKTLPPCHLSCLPAYMALHESLAWARVEARRSGDGREGPRSRPR